MLSSSDCKAMGFTGLAPSFHTLHARGSPNSPSKHCSRLDVRWCPGALWVPQFLMNLKPITHDLSLVPPHPLPVLHPVPSYLWQVNTDLLLKKQPRLPISCCINSKYLLQLASPLQLTLTHASQLIPSTSPSHNAQLGSGQHVLLAVKWSLLTPATEPPSLPVTPSFALYLAPSYSAYKAPPDPICSIPFSSGSLP